LLKAAGVLFAERGYDGVAVDEVVQRAGVNKRMVYHYFGSKEGMYGEVLRAAYAKAEASEAATFARVDAVQDPEGAMEETVHEYFIFLQKHPDFVRLLLWENLNEGRHLRLLKSPVTKSPMLSHLTRVLEAGAASGRFRKNLDPRSVLVSLIGLCFVYFSNRHTLSATVGIKMSGPAARRAAAKHATMILLHGIALSVGEAEDGESHQK